MNDRKDNQMEERKETFARNFFRLYDRKIASGELTFSRSGIRRDDFTRLCTDSEFVFPKEEILLFCEKAQLTEEEAASLLKFAE